MGGVTKNYTEVDRASRRAAFMAWFGLPRREAETLTALVMAEGKPLTAQQLAALTFTNPVSIQVSVVILRKAMEAEAIDRDESGYWLTDIGLAEAREAMAAMARSLAA